MADSVEDRVGQQLGNYRLLRFLRREGTTDVYLGEHIFLKTQAAIKVLPGQLSQQELEAFLAETRNIARMKHPNILRILEFGVEGRTPFLVTDYTLNGSLRQLYPTGTPVPSDKIVSYVKQIAAALQYIHAQGLVHGAIRPENMLLGPQDRILLSGFSSTIDALDEASARNTLISEEERARELIYVAPEQRHGKPGPASDQYALSMVVYEWLSGGLPFRGSPGEIERRSLTPILLQTKLPVASPELAQVIATALAQDPQQRFADISTFASALEQILQPTPLPGNIPPAENERAVQDLTEPPHISNKTNRRSRVARGVSIGLILMVLLLVGAGFLFSRQTTVVTTVQATQTTVARSTQQAVAAFTARSPQEIYTAATSGNPLIDDPLTNKSKSTWQSFQGNLYGCTFNGGMYMIRVEQTNSYLNCSSHKNNLHNFAFEVEMSIVKGDNGGLTFRSNSDNSKFYALRIVESGSSFVFGFVLYNNGERKELQDTIFNEGKQKFNLFSVIAYEHIFYFYINKNFLMKAQDNTLQIGAPGMYALDAADNTATQTVFRNAKIWVL